MKNLIIALLVGTVSCSSLAYASDSTNYDSQASSLVANILSILDNDVPPPADTGSSTLSSHEIISLNVLTPFVQKGTSFILTAKGLSTRRNGGVLLKEVQGAVDYLSSQNLTKYTTAASFQPDASLRRDEAAKFFSLFAEQVMHKTPDESKTCAFTDLAE